MKVETKATVPSTPMIKFRTDRAFFEISPPFKVDPDPITGHTEPYKITFTPVSPPNADMNLAWTELTIAENATFPDRVKNLAGERIADYIRALPEYRAQGWITEDIAFNNATKIAYYEKLEKEGVFDKQINTKKKIDKENE